jgi:hypothetical protein
MILVSCAAIGSPSERWAGHLDIGSLVYSWTIFESPRPQYRSFSSRL